MQGIAIAPYVYITKPTLAHSILSPVIVGEDKYGSTFPGLNPARHRSWPGLQSCIFGPNADTATVSTRDSEMLTCCLQVATLRARGFAAA